MKSKPVPLHYLFDDVASLRTCFEILSQFVHDDTEFPPPGFDLKIVIHHCIAAISVLHFLYSLLTLEQLSHLLTSPSADWLQAYTDFAATNTPKPPQVLG